MINKQAKEAGNTDLTSLDKTNKSSRELKLAYQKAYLLLQKALNKAKMEKETTELGEIYLKLKNLNNL